MSWSFNNSNYAVYYSIQFGSPTVSYEASEVALFYGMGSENVSSIAIDNSRT